LLRGVKHDFLHFEETELTTLKKNKKGNRVTSRNMKQEVQIFSIKTLKTSNRHPSARDVRLSTAGWKEKELQRVQ